MEAGEEEAGVGTTLEQRPPDGGGPEREDEERRASSGLKKLGERLEGQRRGWEAEETEVGPGSLPVEGESVDCLCTGAWPGSDEAMSAGGGWGCEDIDVE